MSQSSVTVSINGKEYPMACSPGQENHVMALGKRIDQVVRSVAAASGPIGEARLLVMAALILTDRLTEAESRPAPDASADGGEESASAMAGEAPKESSTGASAAESDSTEMARLINNLAGRIEKLA